MKKYLIMFLLVTFHVSAMEKNDNYSFYHLPLNVLNYIARLLGHETDDEFIVRTNNTVKMVPSRLYRSTSQGAIRTSRDSILSYVGHLGQRDLRAFCPDETKFVMLETSMRDVETRSVLRIINARDSRLLYRRLVDRNECKNIAISCSGSMIAKVHASFPADSLVIQKINNSISGIGKEITIPLPEYFTARIVAFDKQGTRVIIHGIGLPFDQYQNSYMIFSLKNIALEVVPALEWETEEELIARAGIKKKVVLSDYIDYAKKDQLGCSQTEWFREFSPGGDLCAVFNYFDYEPAKVTLTIVDVHNKNIMHEKKLQYKDYQCLALSQCGEMVATIYKEPRDLYSPIPFLYHYILAIEKVSTRDKRECKIFPLREPLRASFNRQGTQVIVHGTDYSDKNNACTQHKIFSLKNNSLEELSAKVEKTDLMREEKSHKLQDYFRCYGVCKSITYD